MFLLFCSLWATAAEVEPDEAEEVDVACTDDRTDQAVDAAMALEAAYKNAEQSSFLPLHSELAAGLECLNRPLEPEEVVQIHRARALWYFSSSQPGNARASFAAVQQLDPTWRIGQLTTTETHPIVGIWDSAPKDRSRASLNRAPAGGWVIDGMPAEDVPDARAFVVQGYNADGSLWFSGHLTDVSELPTAPLDEAARKRRRMAIRITGSVVGAGLTATGATFLGLGLSDRAAMQRDDFAYDDIDSVGERRNTRLNVGFATAAPGLLITGLTWGIPW